MVFDFLADIEPQAAEVELLLSQGRLALSTISTYELFRGVKIKRHITQREQFVELCHEYPMDNPVVRMAAEIYTDLKSAGRMIPNEDILIAATAIHYSVPLLTANRRHFERIKGLRLFS